MEPLIGRTVSQIKNRYYQNLKDKDISLIKYKVDIKTKRQRIEQEHSDFKELAVPQTKEFCQKKRLLKSNIKEYSRVRLTTTKESAPIYS